MTLRSKLYESISNNANRLRSGFFNCIQFPYKRLGKFFPGMTWGRMYVVTGGTKSAKTQFSSFTFLFEPIYNHFFAKDRSKSISLKVFYYPWEETPEDVMARFMAYLCYKLSNGKIIVDPDEIQSKGNIAIRKDVEEMINSNEFIGIVDYFESCVQFSSYDSVSDILRELYFYLMENGTVEGQEKDKYEDVEELFGKGVDLSFKKYKAAKPNEIVLAYIDHLSLIDTMGRETPKLAMDKLGRGLIKLRNKMYLSSVILQQQNVNDGVDHIKANRTKPTIAGLQDSKYTAQNANAVFGVYSPHSYDIKKQGIYDITKLGDRYRSLEIMANRNGARNVWTGLLFRGECCFFSELPSSESEMHKVYKSLAPKTDTEDIVSDADRTVDSSNDRIKGVVRRVITNK